MTGSFSQACSASDLQNTESDLNACFLTLPSMVHKKCYARCIEQKLICGSLSYEGSVLLVNPGRTRPACLVITMVILSADEDMGH